MADEQLYDFITNHHGELLTVCAQRMNEAPAVGFEPMLDEIVHALQRDAGIASQSPLPGWSEAAAQFGSDHYKRGIPIATVARHVGSISDSIGELANKYRCHFGPREYQILNRCLDALIAAAVDQFWSDARAELEHSTTERFSLIAHELRNGVATAKMAFTMIQSGQTGTCGHTAEALHRALARLDQLIDQALIDAHLRAHAAVDAVRIDLGRTLHELVADVGPERGVAIAIEAAAGTEVVTDLRLFTSVITNVVQNAVKFTQDHGHVVVRAWSDARGVVIEIEDECGGLRVDPEDLFKPHARGKSGRRGFGLGLTIVRDAVQALGGTVQVVDRPGIGCVFAVTLRSAGVPDGT